MREKYIISDDSILEMFEELSDTSNMYQEYIQKMVITNEAMVELC